MQPGAVPGVSKPLPDLCLAGGPPGQLLLGEEGRRWQGAAGQMPPGVPSGQQMPAGHAAAVMNVAPRAIPSAGPPRQGRNAGGIHGSLSPLVSGRLDQEICEFQLDAAPNAQESWTRRVLLQLVGWITQELWPGSSVHSYGSQAVGLSLPESDLDVGVHFPAGNELAQGSTLDEKCVPDRLLYPSDVGVRNPFSRSTFMKAFQIRSRVS